MSFFRKALMPFFLIIAVLMFSFIWSGGWQAPANANVVTVNMDHRAVTPFGDPPLRNRLIYSKVLPVDGMAKAYFNRGSWHRGQHKIDEAIADFSKAIALNPGQLAYYLERSNARIVNEDYDGAIADATEAIKLSPKKAEAYFLRGLALMFKGNLQEALVDGFKSIEINPDYKYAKRLIFEVSSKIEALNQSAH